jgi:amidohydrolase
VLQEAARDAVGEENVLELPPTMGGEDFSYFSLERPSFFFMVGVQNEERGIVWPHHHPKFDLDEEGMGTRHRDDGQRRDAMSGQGRAG